MDWYVKAGRAQTEHDFETWKQKREAAAPKRDRDGQPRSDSIIKAKQRNDNKLDSAATGSAFDGAKPLYTKCTKCDAPTPHGRPLPNPL